MATNMNVSIRYSTHLPMLLEAMERTTGDVLELGPGVFSTPILHWLCERDKRNLVTIESDKGWLKFCKQYYQTDLHKFHHVKTWDEADSLINKKWDVVLVDHSPSARRVEEIKKLANLAKYIVIHDANEWHERIYHLSTIYPLFKYKFIFEGAEPHVAVLSNFVDLENFSTPKTELCELAKKYGADKCPQIGHQYTPFYYELFKDKRNDIKKVFEFGVGNMRQYKHIPNYKVGASLHMWRDFFPNAQVYGADNKPDSVFKTDRLETFLCDERYEEQVIKLIKKVGADIDIFIDDASHHVHDQRFLCETVMPLLKKDVIYIIEDTRRYRMLAKQLPQYDCVGAELLPNTRIKHNDGLLIVTHKK